MGGPEARFENIDGFTRNDDGSVSITAEAAEEILAILREQDPETTMTVEQITAITDMQEAFGILFDRGFGPGGPMGGPTGGPMGGPGGMEPGETGEPSADFFMNDTVNAFSGVADEEVN